MIEKLPEKLLDVTIYISCNKPQGKLTGYIYQLKLFPFQVLFLSFNKNKHKSFLLGQKSLQHYFFTVFGMKLGMNSPEKKLRDGTILSLQQNNETSSNFHRLVFVHTCTCISWL